MGNTCSGDPSRFAKIADLLSRLRMPSPEVLHFTLLISVTLLCVEQIFVKFFWKHGKTQKSPLSLSSLLRCTSFSKLPLKCNCTALYTILFFLPWLWNLTCSNRVKLLWFPWLSIHYIKEHITCIASYFSKEILLFIYKEKWANPPCILLQYVVCFLTEMTWHSPDSSMVIPLACWQIKFSIKVRDAQ